MSGDIPTTTWGYHQTPPLISAYKTVKTAVTQDLMDGTELAHCAANGTIHQGH
jgi:hypothetical protein